MSDAIIIKGDRFTMDALRSSINPLPYSSDSSKRELRIRRERKRAMDCVNSDEGRSGGRGGGLERGETGQES